MDRKLHQRDMNIVNEENKDDVKTSNKLIIECVIDYAEAEKRVSLLRKLNLVRKHKGSMTSHQLVGSNRRHLTLQFSTRLFFFKRAVTKISGSSTTITKDKVMLITPKHAK